MATELILVRHGVTDWNDQGRLMGRADIPLNQRGREQATAAGEALRSLNPGSVLSSPQQRTLESAALIAEACGIETSRDDRLAEVWIRAWQGKTFELLRDDRDVHAYLKDPFHVCDEIEPFTEVRNRICSLIEHFRENASEQPVVLVSHGDPLRILVSEAIGLEPGRFRDFSIDNGSITRVRIGRKKSHVTLLNWLPGPLQ